MQLMLVSERTKHSVHDNMEWREIKRSVIGWVA